jgi:hypothetical protein
MAGKVAVPSGELESTKQFLGVILVKNSSLMIAKE